MTPPPQWDLTPARRLSALLCFCSSVLFAQGTVPVFQHTVGDRAYTLVGQDPASSDSATIPTILVPVTLTISSRKVDAEPIESALLRSPVFADFAFPSGDTTQYVDALLRTTLRDAGNWHTRLGKPEMKPVKIAIPVGYGYVLTSKKSSGAVAVVDVEFLQKEIFKQVPKQPGKLVIVVTRNTTYYAEGDATLCCSWGTHGVDATTGNSFVLASYIEGAPAVVQDRDVQPLTQQLAEFVNDPLHDPLVHGGGRRGTVPGNAFPAWTRPASMRPGDQGA